MATRSVMASAPTPMWLVMNSVSLSSMPYTLTSSARSRAASDLPEPYGMVPVPLQQGHLTLMPKSLRNGGARGP